MTALERCSDTLTPQLVYAFEQFNRGEYWHQHETLEAVWRAEPDESVRNFYKGILQVGVGCHHLLRGNYRGALIKLQTGADYLEPYRPRCLGVDVEALIAAARRLRIAVVAAGPDRLAEVDRALLPLVSVDQLDDPS